MAKKIQTTLHISKQVRDRFKAQVIAQDQDMSEVVEKLMSDWSDNRVGTPDRVQMDHAVRLLSKAVADELLQNTRWATDALIGAGMGLPGSTVFDRRIDHFSEEKQELGRRFANWLIRRSLSIIDQGSKVVLLCDSGTTIFWFLKALGQAMDEQTTRLGGAERLKNVTVVTNNIPGAESFVTYASHHAVTIKGVEVRISDLVDCRLLAGTFLPEYVAITGDDTNRDLGNYVEQVKASKKQSGAVVIGVTTSNWIAIEGAPGASFLSFLARGRGHGAFKKKLLEVADEIFAIAPLGKLLIHTSVGELNKLLNFTSDATNPQEKSYEVFDTPAKKRPVTKIVSTTREQRSVLRDHSALLRRALGESMHLPPHDQLDQEDASTPIAKVKQLFFAFDRFADLPADRQLAIELPHEKTRTDAFKKQVFSIQD